MLCLLPPPKNIGLIDSRALVADANQLREIDIPALSLPMSAFKMAAISISATPEKSRISLKILLFSPGVTTPGC